MLKKKKKLKKKIISTDSIMIKIAINILKYCSTLWEIFTMINDKESCKTKTNHCVRSPNNNKKMAVFTIREQTLSFIFMVNF